jgi:hypothetical protein
MGRFTTTGIVCTASWFSAISAVRADALAAGAEMMIAITASTAAVAVPTDATASQPTSQGSDGCGFMWRRQPTRPRLVSGRCHPHFRPFGSAAPALHGNQECPARYWGDVGGES